MEENKITIGELGYRESEEKYRALFESSSDAIMLLTSDQFLDCNPATLKMFGCKSRDEFLGKHPGQVSPQFQPNGRDSYENANEHIANAFKNGKESFEWMHRRVDGTDFPAEVLLTPIKFENQPILQATVRDITERKQAEEALRESKAPTETIVEHIPLMIFLKEAKNLNFVLFNRAGEDLLGYSRDNLIGKNDTDFFPPREAAFFMAKDREVMNGMSDVLDIPEESITTLKRGQRLLHTKKICIRGKDGVTKYLMGISEDITERKKAEEHLKELNDVRSKFISIISHQLRTPLTAINWNLEAILEGDFGKLDETTHKFLQITHKESVEMARRINDLLITIDIEEGRMVLEKEEINLESIVGEIVAEMMKKCALKNITCRYIAPTVDIPAIDGDGEKIRTVIIKLMENAVAYTKDDGKISIKLEMENDMIRFEVKDNGVGIPTHEQHHIFTRFFRASNASIMQTDAFGLGLFIAKSFVEQHGGKIGCESKEGEGSVFWFKIPYR
ncbi:MAG: PAS domain S-box protein [Patescibacteria group bacterium]